MKTPTLALLLAAVCASAFAAQDIKPKFRSKRWQEVTARLDHLRLEGGRNFYRGPQMLRNFYPYYLAANADERSANHGYELRVSNAHQLLEPIATPEAATELARLFTGGIIVPDLATYQALLAEAVRLKPKATGWGIKIHDGTPETVGLKVKRTDRGFKVSMLVFTCSGYCRLAVVEQHYTVPIDGQVEVETKSWIEGPPQSWQTSGDYDQASQDKLQAEVDRFRAAAMAIVARHRTIEQFRKVCAGDPTFAEVRHRLGEPDRDVGSGIHIYVYGLGDGTAVVFGAGGDDHKMSYIRHVETVSYGGPLSTKFGRLLEKIK